jgi:hypothetical protein
VEPDRPGADGADTGGCAGEAAAGPAGLLSSALAGFREPIVVVLLAIAFFSAISGKPLDGALLLAVAVSLARDSARRGGEGERATRRRPGQGRLVPGWALALAGVLYAAVTGTFTRFSWPATAAVAGLGAVVVVIGWRGPLRPTAARDRLPAAGTALWLGLLVLGGVWELWALLRQPTLTATSYAHPTISALTDPLLAAAGGRSLVLAAWLAAGWYLARR